MALLPSAALLLLMGAPLPAVCWLIKLPLLLLIMQESMQQQRRLAQRRGAALLVAA